MIDKLKTIRETKKISRAKVADFLCMSYEGYKAIENKRVRLTLENYLLICEYLELDPKLLLKDSQNEIFISVTKKEAEILKEFSKKIENNFELKDININTTGDVIIGNNNKNK